MTSTAAPPPASPAPITILRYGEVAPLPPGLSRSEWPATPPEEFAQQMGWLRERGYTALAMRDLEPYLLGAQTGRVVGLALDASVGASEHALPVLRAHGFTATGFAVSARLGESWDGHRGGPPYRMMDASQLRAWVGAGQEVGAHSRHHVDLRTLDEWSAWTEIAGCKDDLEHAVGTPVRHYCYPFGRMAPVLAAMARAAGYATAATVLSPRPSGRPDLFALPMLSVGTVPAPASVWLRLTLGIEEAGPPPRAG